MARITIETDGGNTFTGTYTVAAVDDRCRLEIKYSLSGTLNGEKVDLVYTWNNDASDEPDCQPHLLTGEACGLQIRWEDPSDGIEDMGHPGWDAWCLIKELSVLHGAVDSLSYK